MDYLHCPTCRCAYNVAKQPACPTCGIGANTPAADPTAAVVAAAEQLAAAVARATPAQLVAAQAELAMREATRVLPSPAALPALPTSLLRAVRAALAPLVERLAPPAPHVVTGKTQRAMLAGAVIALLTRLPRPRQLANRARLLLGR